MDTLRVCEVSGQCLGGGGDNDSLRSLEAGCYSLSLCGSKVFAIYSSKTFCSEIVILTVYNVRGQREVVQNDRDKKYTVTHTFFYIVFS